MLTVSVRHLTRRVRAFVVLHHRTISAVKSKHDEAGMTHSSALGSYKMRKFKSAKVRKWTCIKCESGAKVCIKC